MGIKMGIWYRYKIEFANKESGNLTEKLVQKGILKEDPENADSIWVNLKALNKEMFKGLERIRVDKEEDGILFYASRIPDQSLTFEFSKHLDDVLFITEDNDYGYIHWYEKNGDFCTKSGKNAKACISAIPPKLVTVNGNGYKIRLPIGSEEDKWGFIYLKEECVAHSHSLKEDRFHIDSPVTVLFDKERVPVYFRSGKVEMDATEIKERYMQSKEDFRRFANQSVVLEVPYENVCAKTTRYGSLLIVKIPCPPKYSSDEEMSFVVNGVRDTGEGTYLVDIGPRFAEHTVYYKENGRNANTHFKNQKIAEIFKEGFKHFIYSDAVEKQTHVNEELFKTYPTIIYAEDFIAHEQQENIEESFEK